MSKPGPSDKSDRNRSSKLSNDDEYSDLVIKSLNLPVSKHNRIERQRRRSKRRPA